MAARLSGVDFVKGREQARSEVQQGKSRLRGDAFMVMA